MTHQHLINSSRCWKKLILCVMLWLLAAASQDALAQSSACTPNEDVVTFNFAGTASTNANGSSGTWTAGSLVNAYQVATAGTIRSNTITFTAQAIASAPFVAPDPSLLRQGNVNNSLSMNMNPGAPGDGVTLTLVFSRPMDKVRFNMLDVDRQNPNWQDRMRISGYLNGSAVPIPALVPTTPARFSTATVGNANEITTNTNFNCSATNASCNVRIDFSNPIDSVVLAFVAGPAIAAPSAQRVAFNNFSYCVPKRDLRILKATPITPLVAGKTATYSLTINNRGGAATTGNTSVTDVISTPGVSFLNPQTPAGWTCAVANTTFTNDTANCFRAASIGANSTVVLTLTVSISPDASATSIVNRAKVYAGGDPNKLTLTATGPIANCDASNENQSGGGAFYFGGVDTTNAGCSFETTPVVRQSLLTVSKMNSGNTLPAGSTTSYTVTFANLGPSNAPGSVVKDPAVAGLNCTTATFTSTPAGSITTSPTVLNMTALQSTGVTFTPTFPANSTASFNLICSVTATGLP